MKYLNFVLFFAFAVGVGASAYAEGLAWDYADRDPAYQAQLRREDARVKRNIANNRRIVERAAHSRRASGEGSWDCTYDGRVPQVCYYKMENGLICETKQIDGRISAKGRCL